MSWRTRKAVADFGGLLPLLSTSLLHMRGKVVERNSIPDFRVRRRPENTAGLDTNVPHDFLVIVYNFMIFEFSWAEAIYGH